MTYDLFIFEAFRVPLNYAISDYYQKNVWRVPTSVLNTHTTKKSCYYFAFLIRSIQFRR